MLLSLHQITACLNLTKLHTLLPIGAGLTALALCGRQIIIDKRAAPLRHFD